MGSSCETCEGTGLLPETKGLCPDCDGRGADSEVEALRARVTELEAQKNGAYAERNKCVAAMAWMALGLGWTAGVGRHSELDVDWEDDWRTVLFIDLPTGQVTWHFHDSEKALLEDLPQVEDKWDGHTTAEKYDRLARALFHIETEA